LRVSLQNLDLGDVLTAFFGKNMAQNCYVFACPVSHITHPSKLLKPRLTPMFLLMYFRSLGGSCTGSMENCKTANVAGLKHMSCRLSSQHANALNGIAAYLRNQNLVGAGRTYAPRSSKIRVGCYRTWRSAITTVQVQGMFFLIYVVKTFA